MMRMRPGLIRTVARDVLRRPLQTGLMVFGVALGVSVLVAIDTANVSAIRSFDLSTEAIVGRATHQLRGGPAGIAEEVYPWLRAEIGIRAAAPVVEGIALAPDLGGQTLRVLGVDPLAEGPFRDLLPAGSVPGLMDLYTRPGAAILGQALAARLGRPSGSTVRLQVGEQLREVTVLGVLRPAEAQSRLRLDDVVVLDLASAQELLGMVGRLSRIDLILDPEQAARLARLLPADLVLQPASDQRRVAQDLTAAFRLNLTALSLLALVVGMFLVYNTMTFSVLQRREVHAVLRALGVTTGQILGMVLLEAGAIAALGSVCGLALGWLLAQGVIGLVSQTVHELYLPLGVTRVEVLPGVMAKAALMGLAAGLAAAAAPAWEAGQVPVTEALRRSALEQGLRARLPKVTRAGLACGLAGGVLLVVPRESLLASLAGMFAVLIGLALFVPQLTLGLMRLCSRLLPNSLGAFRRMAPRAIGAAISRTGVAIAALMVSLSVAIGVGLMIASFRSTVQNWLDLTLRADVYVGVSEGGGIWSAGRLTEATAERLRSLPGVARVEPFYAVTVDSEVGPVQLLVVDAARERDARLYRFAAGSAHAAWERVQAGAVLVSEPFAYWHPEAAEAGSILLRTRFGLRRLDIAGVYYDYSSEHGAILLGRDAFLSQWDDPGPTSLGVFALPDVATADLAGRIRQALAGSPVLIQENRQLRQEALQVFDSTFAITSALRVLAVLTAFVGVLSALLALQLERSRELATLRALGLTRAGLQRLTLLETGLMGAAASLFSLPTGLLLALLLIYVINLRSFGWTIQMQLWPAPFLQATLVGITSAVLAGVYPVMRLARRSIAGALWAE
jgi:putative ABC transport system permease protein